MFGKHTAVFIQRNENQTIRSTGQNILIILLILLKAHSSILRKL